MVVANLEPCPNWQPTPRVIFDCPIARLPCTLHKLNTLNRQHNVIRGYSLTCRLLPRHRLRATKGRCHSAASKLESYGFMRAGILDAEGDQSGEDETGAVIQGMSFLSQPAMASHKVLCFSFFCFIYDLAQQQLLASRRHGTSLDSIIGDSGRGCWSCPRLPTHPYPLLIYFKPHWLPSYFPLG